MTGVGAVSAADLRAGAGNSGELAEAVRRGCCGSELMLDWDELRLSGGQEQNGTFRFHPFP